LHALAKDLLPKPQAIEKLKKDVESRKKSMAACLINFEQTITTFSRNLRAVEIEEATKNNPNQSLGVLEIHEIRNNCVCRSLY